VALVRAAAAAAAGDARPPPPSMTRLVRAVRALSPEERANTLTHGAGVVLSLAGVAALALQVRAPQEPRHALAIAVYGVCLISLFAASTLCHLATVTTSSRVRRLTLTLDYVCIYLVIAGTYTPFLLTAVGGSRGTALLVAVWALGVAGMLWEVLGGRRSEVVACAAYLAMGWLAVLVAEPLMAALGRDGVGLLVAGGLCYSAGVVFFLLRRMPYAHAVWHLFVLAGSALHYAGVLRLSL